MNLFKSVTLTERSFLQKLFKQQPQENAVKQINNLLSFKEILQITRQDIESISERYKINVEKEFKLNLEEFYAVYLNHCLCDKILSDDELETLKHLKKIFNLDDKDIDNLHIKIGEVIYNQSFKEAVSDGRITQAEETFLKRLEKELRLPKELADKISIETRQNFMSSYITQVIADQRLSPAEEKEMEAIAGSLNIDIKLNEENRVIFDKLKKYWALENLELDNIIPDIALQKNEKCYLIIPNVSWHELRTVRERTTYHGYSTSFKVAKGFYLRSGSYNSQSHSTDKMKMLDAGTLYLTSKRLIFVGSKKNSNIKIEKILGITPYTNGVEIDKDTGRNPMLVLQERADVFCIILERLLRERSHK